MAITESDTTIGDIVNEVGARLGEMLSTADRWGVATQTALEQTPGDSAPQPVDPNVSLPSVPAGSAWSLDAEDPEKPDTDFDDPQVPSSHSLTTIDHFDTPSDPSWSVNFNDVFSTYEPGTKPNLPTYTAPTVTVPEIDPAPEIVAPDDVQLTQTTAPTVPSITWPSFGVSINPANLPSLRNAFDYQEDPFAPEILDDLTARIRTILDNEQIIPAGVWDAIWSRAAGLLKRQELAALREASRAHAAAGWMMPGPVLFARESAARQKTAEGLSELSRENATKQAEFFREDLWKAMETGIAIETLLERVHSQARERALRSAIEANNAGIAVYRAALEAYQITEIAAKDLLVKLKDLELRGSLAELEEFDRELKAAGFNLEYDKNQVELYKAQWGGEETKAKAYDAYANAIRAYVQSQQAAVEAFGTQVQSNNTILQGWAIEWDAYVKRLRPAELRIQAHEARSSHFGRLVQELQTKGQIEGQRVDSDIKIEQLHLGHMSAEIEKFKAMWAGIQTKLDALTKVYATDAQVYQAKGQVEASRQQSLNSRYEVDVRKAAVDLQAKTAGLQTRLGYWDRWLQTWVQWNTASAGAYAQLGAAAYSIGNYTLGASGSSGYNNSYSYSKSDDTNTSYNYDMAGS